jgi:hypothetical protein
MQLNDYEKEILRCLNENAYAIRIENGVLCIYDKCYYLADIDLNAFKKDSFEELEEGKDYKINDLLGE